MQDVSILEVVRNSINTNSSLAEDKGLEVRMTSRGDNFQFCGDPDRLTQIVTNLLSNAIKFTDNGFIACDLERSEDRITVKVTDTGVGLSRDDLPHIFDKFKQAGDTLTDKPKGTGLGLPICKEIIDYYHGRIWAESEPGKGSTFAFSLPVSEKTIPIG